MLYKHPNSKYDIGNDDWSVLDKLPEGTVSEAYLSLDQLFTTDELLLKLKDFGKITHTWLAVDIGLNKYGEPFTQAIGFPYQTNWLRSEMTVVQLEEKKLGLFRKTSTSSI